MVDVLGASDINYLFATRTNVLPFNNLFKEHMVEKFDRTTNANQKKKQITPAALTEKIRFFRFTEDP